MTPFDVTESYDPSTGYRRTNISLYNYVRDMSEKGFALGDSIRNSITTKEEFLAYQKKMKKVFRDSVGYVDYNPDLPLNAVTTGVIEEEDLIIEKVVFESRKNVYVTANLYIPKNISGKRPGILFQVGHAEEGKVYEPYQAVARIMARGGNVVLIMDPQGQGERGNYIENGIDTPLVNRAVFDHQMFGAQTFLVRGNCVSYFVADAMRAIDYLQSRPEVDAEKIGATGSSGGGTQTCVISLMDDRVKASAPGTFVSTRKDIFIQGGAQDSEQIWPGTTDKGFDHHELISCFCPKPYLILAVKSDFFPVEGARRVYNTNKKFYSMFDAEDRLDVIYDDSQHAYTKNLAKTASEFFAKHLAGEEVTVSIENVAQLPQETLLVTKSGNVYREYANSVSPWQENKAEYESLTEAPKTIEEKKKFFTERIYKNRVECPFDVVHLDTDYSCGLYMEKILWHPQDYVTDFGLLIRKYTDIGKNIPVTICLWEDGTNDIGRHKEEITKILDSGRAALVADVASVGTNSPLNITPGTNPRSVYGFMEKLNKDMVFAGDSLLALMAYDLVKTAEMLKEEYGVEDIDIFTCGSYSILGEIAKIVLGTEYTAVNPMKFSDIINNKYYIYYNLAHLIMPEAGLYLE